MNETTGITVSDSTSPAYNGTPHNVTLNVAGKIGNGDLYNGSSSYVSLSTVLNGQITGPFTVSCWIRKNTSPTVACPLFMNYNQASDRRGIALRLSNGTSPHPICQYIGNGTMRASANSTAGVADNGSTWYYVMSTWDGTTAAASVRTFLNGIDRTGATATTGFALTAGATTPCFGYGRVSSTPPGTQYFPGIMDEMRISRVNRTATWLVTEYANQNSPSTFYAVDAEETPTGLGSVVLADHETGQVPDAFGGSGSATDAELFAFRLLAPDSEDAEIGPLEFTMTDVSGLLDSDWTGVELMVDTNGDGHISAEETGTVGGAGVVDTGARTVTFTTPFTILSGQTNRYVLRADFASLAAGDKVALDLVPAGITAEGQTTHTSLGAIGRASEATHIESGSIAISDHDAGQQGDAFGGRGRETDAELFSFDLDVSSKEGAEVTELVFTLSDVTGLGDGDWAGIELVEDENGDGNIGAGESTKVGGAGAVNTVAGTLTFPGDFVLAAGVSKHYILCADFATLEIADKVLIDFFSDGVSARGTVSGEDLPVAGVVTQQAWHLESAVLKGWYGHDWTYRKRLTLDRTLVAGDLTGFPVLISRTDTDWRDEGHEGHVAQTAGEDILFTDATGEMKLPHEFEVYDSSSGLLIAWVQVPNVWQRVDTEIYVYYGNPSCEEQEDAAGVWDSQYVAVWHLNESSGVTAYNATTVPNCNGTHNSVTVNQTGKIGPAARYSGSSPSHTDLGAAVDDSLPLGLTVSCWMSQTLGNSAAALVANYRYNGYPSHKGFQLRLTTGGSSHELGLYIKPQDAAGPVQYVQSPRNVNEGAGWRYCVGTWTGENLLPSQCMRVYVDGEHVTVKASDSYNVSMHSSGFSMYIARAVVSMNGYEQWFRGPMDEVRISKAARSAAWIATEYENQNDPGTFYAVGEEEELARGTVLLLR